MDMLFGFGMVFGIGGLIASLIRYYPQPTPPPEPRLEKSAWTDRHVHPIAIAVGYVAVAGYLVYLIWQGRHG